MNIKVVAIAVIATISLVGCGGGGTNQTIVNTSDLPNTNGDNSSNEQFSAYSDGTEFTLAGTEWRSGCLVIDTDRNELGFLATNVIRKFTETEYFELLATFDNRQCEGEPENGGPNQLPVGMYIITGVMETSIQGLVVHEVLKNFGALDEEYYPSKHYIDQNSDALYNAGDSATVLGDGLHVDLDSPYYRYR